MAGPAEWAPAAVEDLEDIWGHIALDSPNAADRVIRRLHAAAERLAEFPLIGVARDELAPGMRLWPVGSYVLLHRIDGRTVTIVRALWGGRDLPALF